MIWIEIPEMDAWSMTHQIGKWHPIERLGIDPVPGPADRRTQTTLILFRSRRLARCSKPTFPSDSAPDFQPHSIRLVFYCQLRKLNPATFAALLRYGTLTIGSSSPERFLNLDGQQVETRPIKGRITRSDD